ncbi:MAG: hypothetical protein KIT74_10315 [Fimbriimonadales bacterium]|nr:hypothetical protein [Fimbriimonadales bacterium]
MLKTLAIVLTAFTAAQDIKDNPLALVAAEFGSQGFSTKAAPIQSPTAFSPSGKRVYVSQFAAAVTEDKAERDALVEGLELYLKAYEEAAKEGKFSNDASSSLAFSIAVLYGTAKGIEVDDAVLMDLIPKIKSSMDVASVRNATNLQKQTFYEFSLCVSGFVVVLAGASDSAEHAVQIQKLAESSLTALTGAKLHQFSIAGKSLSIKPESKPSEPAPTGGLAAGFSFTAPSGWQKSGNWWVGSKIEATGSGDTKTSALVMLLPARPASGNMGDALRQIWREYLPKGLEGRAGGMVYRRYVGDGLFGQFIFGSGREEGRRSDTLYTVMMIDCGNEWQPVIIAQIFEDLAVIKTGEAVMARASFPESALIAEQFLGSFRCASAKGKPIVSQDSLAAYYHYGSSGHMQWENIYTGATAMTVVTYGGELNLKSDGTFTYRFVSASGVVGVLRTGQARGSGSYAIQGDLLICTFQEYDQGDGHKVKELRYRIAGLTQFEDGSKVAVLMSDLNLIPCATTLGNSADWFTTKKKQ